MGRKTQTRQMSVDKL